MGVYDNQNVLGDLPQTQRLDPMQILLQTLQQATQGQGNQTSPSGWSSQALTPPQATQMQGPSQLDPLHVGPTPTPQDFGAAPQAPLTIPGHPKASAYLEQFLNGFNAARNPQYFQQMQENARQQEQFQQQQQQRGQLTAFEQAQLAAQNQAHQDAVTRLNQEAAFRLAKESSGDNPQFLQGPASTLPGIQVPPPQATPGTPSTPGGVEPGPWRNPQDHLLPPIPGTAPTPGLDFLGPIQGSPMAPPPGMTQTLGNQQYHANPDYDSNPTDPNKFISVPADSGVGKAWATSFGGNKPDKDGNYNIPNALVPFVQETLAQQSKDKLGADAVAAAKQEGETTNAYIDKYVKDPKQAEALKQELNIALLRVGQTNGKTTEFFQTAKEIRKAVTDPTTENVNQWNAQMSSSDPTVAAAAKVKWDREMSRQAASRASMQYIVNDLPKSGQADPTPNLHGEDFLSTLTPATANTIRGMMDGRLKPPSINSRAPADHQVLLALNKADPDFNEFRYAARKAVAPGTTLGKNNANLNTAVGHMDQMMEAAKQLQNSNFQPTNDLKQWWSELTGSSIPTNFAGVQQALSGEMARGLTGNATVPEIAELKASMNKKFSSNQFGGQGLNGYGNEMLRVLGTKLLTNQEQYEQALNLKPGEHDKYFKVILPSAQKVFQKYGQDPLGVGSQGPQSQSSSDLDNSIREFMKVR